ncbi:MAG: nucleotide exchange factor GrpE, partial [Candidatus Roizmanbacteria bacterium]
MKKQVQEIDSRLEEAQIEIEEANQKFLRAQADYQNLEGRIGKQIEEHTNRSRERLLKKVIELVDDMSAAEAFVTDAG